MAIKNETWAFCALHKNELQRLVEIAESATFDKWSWWSSNSHFRLSSDSSGKDGDVISASKAVDGLAVVNCKAADREFIATFNPVLVRQLLELAKERYMLRSLPDLNLITLPGEHHGQKNN